MVNIIFDISILQAADGSFTYKLAEADIEMDKYIFEKYKIDSTQFKESNYYYTSKVDDYDEILNEVQKRLEKLNEFYNKEKKLKDSLETATKKTEDSIKRVERFKKPIRKPTSIDKIKK